MQLELWFCGCSFSPTEGKGNIKMAVESVDGVDERPAGGVCCTEELLLLLLLEVVVMVVMVVGIGRSISSWHIAPKARIGPPSSSWEGPRGVFIPGQRHTDGWVSDSGTI